ncbi:MAG: sugar phosphate isomerase/epimerase [Pirellulaceae bacterium]|nr:sugar phosphate isomerase/epimerase [Pirellulaceae bacterium]
MGDRLNRRQILVRAGIGAGAGLLGGMASANAAESPAAVGEPFRYCLNTGTIMGQKLSVRNEVEVAAAAGYSGIEPWIRSLRQHVEDGHSLADLRKQIADSGLTVESAIGFPAWAVDDDARRQQALEEFKRDMDLIAQIGGKRIAAPPAGVNNIAGMDLLKVAERYRAALELGREMGVVPQLEIWGTAQTLGKVGEAALVAIQSNDPDACLLLDVYHIFRSGTGFEGLRLLNGAAMHVFHINDYPADPPREQMNDSHRVFPGDGVAPLDQILRGLHASGFRGALSLELFNRDYWQQDAATVARKGLEKMQQAVRRALA